MLAREVDGVEALEQHGAGLPLELERMLQRRLCVDHTLLHIHGKAMRLRIEHDMGREGGDGLDRQSHGRETITHAVTFEYRRE